MENNIPIEGSEEPRAVELWDGIRDREYWPALPQLVIEATLERYVDDTLGAAMAADISHVLVAEFPLNGQLDEEADVIDDLVDVLRQYDLEGISIEELGSALKVDFNLGGLAGIIAILELLNDKSQSGDIVDELRKQFSASDVLQATEEQKEEDHLYKEYGIGKPLEESSEEFVIEEETDEETDEQPLTEPNTVMVDELGEEFVI